MKFYISTTGIKRVTISNSGGSVGKGSTVAAYRRISSRTVLSVVLLLGILLPFLFVRIAFLVLESATACNSTFGKQINYQFPFFFFFSNFFRSIAVGILEPCSLLFVLLFIYLYKYLYIFKSSLIKSK